MIRKVVAVAVGELLVGSIGYLATRPQHVRTAAYSVTPVPTLPVAGTAPAFALRRLGGVPPVDPASTRGTPTVVNFFASWCHNCQAELGDFATSASRTQGRLAAIGGDANDADSAAAQGRVVHVALDAQSASAPGHRTAVPMGSAG